MKQMKEKIQNIKPKAHLGEQRQLRRTDVNQGPSKNKNIASEERIGKSNWKCGKTMKAAENNRTRSMQTNPITLEAPRPTKPKAE